MSYTMKVESSVSAGIQGPIRKENGTISVSVGTPLRAFQRAYASLVLESVGNNKTKASEILGVTHATLRNLLDPNPLAEEDQST